MVDLETLLALDAAGVFDGWRLPPVADLDAAVAAWLVHWDAYIDDLDPRPGYKAERRAVLDRTFAALRARCAAAEDQRR